MNECLLDVSPNGTLTAIYNDDLVDLMGQAQVHITRASHVEPTTDGTGWMADLSPSNGPLLGPFRLREDALQAEVRWLHEHLS